MFRTLLTSRKLRSFARNEDGSASLEAMIMMPLVFWVYMAMFAFFNTYQEYNVNQKAAYTIGDMISRETLPLDTKYMDGVQDLLDYMTHSSEVATVRVTSLKYDADNKRFHVDWSRTRGQVQPATNTDVAQWTTRIPALADDEYIVVTETLTKYDPPFNVGLGRREIENFVFTRPRYAPRVLYTGS